MNSLLIRSLSEIAQVRVFLVTTLENPNKPSDLSDNLLVNQSWQAFIYIAAIVFVLSLITIVGIVSKKAEHAIAVALVASLLMIGFFFLTGL
ncbi:MAG: hypothetical protein KME10_12380 [Plectolyngbya sp. WJT66-NPBG17]|nr:hypothetical protein [Plectolyngbya sp. WJT66-NPBG17]